MRRRVFLKALGIGCMGCCGSPLAALADNGRTAKGGRGAVHNGLHKLAPGSMYAPSLDGVTYDRQELMNRYDSGLADKRSAYVPVFGEASVDAILQDMRAMYETIIPDIPYVGRFNYHLQYLIPSAEELAEYLVAKNYGMSSKEFGDLRLEKAIHEIYQMPEEARYMAGISTFGLMTEIQMRLVAWWSQVSPYPEDSKLTYLKGNGTDYDWGADYTQCATDFLYAKYDANDLMINLTCKYDFIPGMAFNIGYHRTMILPEGAPVCDLRWKWGKEVVMPD